MKEKSQAVSTHSAPTVACQKASVVRTALLSLAVGAWLLGCTPAMARNAQPPSKQEPTSAPSATPVACPAPTAPTTEQIATLRKQAQPDRGVLWEIRKGEQHAYLLGTIHLGKVEWIFPGPRTQQAIDGAPAIALELDPLDPQIAQQLSRYMTQDTDVQKLILRNNPQINERLDRLAATFCIPATQFNQLGVIGKMMTLGMMDAMAAGYSPLMGVDLMLAATARKAHKPIVALETVEEQINALGLGSNKLADTATPEDFDKALTEVESGKSRALMRKLATLWQQGDLAGVDTLMRTCNCMDDIGMKAALLDERNQRMTQRIPQHIAQHPHLLIAVGLLHMVGDNNVLQLLEKQGYTVRLLTGINASKNAP